MDVLYSFRTKPLPDVRRQSESCEILHRLCHKRKSEKSSSNYVYTLTFVKLSHLMRTYVFLHCLKLVKSNYKSMKCLIEMKQQSCETLIITPFLLFHSKLASNSHPAGPGPLC